MRPFRTLATSSVALASWTAHACTVCDSRNGQQLRAGLFDGHFLHTLALVLAPVPVFLAAALLAHFGMPDLAEPEPQQAPEPRGVSDLGGGELLA